MTQQSLYKGMVKDKSVYVTPPEDGKAKIFDVPSKSVEGKTYKLRVMQDGELRCSCPFFVFSGKICSHIESFASMKKPESTKPMQEKPKPVQKDIQVRLEGKPSAKDMAIVEDLLNEKRVVPF